MYCVFDMLHSGCGKLTKTTIFFFGSANNRFAHLMKPLFQFLTWTWSTKSSRKNNLFFWFAEFFAALLTAVKPEHKKKTSPLPNGPLINLPTLVLLWSSVGHDSFMMLRRSVENKTAGDSRLRPNINQPNWWLQIAGATVTMEGWERLQRCLKPLSWQRSHPWQGSRW